MGKRNIMFKMSNTCAKITDASICMHGQTGAELCQAQVKLQVVVEFGVGHY